MQLAPEVKPWPLQHGQHPCFNSRSPDDIEFTSGGSGLGLAIAWQLVEAHGDRIWVESWTLVMGQGLAAWLAGVMYETLPTQHKADIPLEQFLL